MSDEPVPPKLSRRLSRLSHCLKRLSGALTLWLATKRVRRLRREWLNDVLAISGGVVFADAVRDPGREFLAWLDGRLLDPYHLSHRALQQARSRVNPELALTLVTVRWRQEEIAWARRMRFSQDDQTACLTGCS